MGSMSDDPTRPDTGGGDDVAIEHEPTVTWVPEEVLEEGDLESHVEGTFAWALTIERGPRAGLTYVLGPGNTIAGRSGDAGIFLADVTVSREHVRFQVSSDGLSMTDLGSTNGTYVNGRRFEAGRLSEGDDLMIGKFHLRVSKGDG